MNASSQPTSATAAGTIVTSAGLLIASNTSRRSFVIQNVGTNPVYIGYGLSTVSSSTYHTVLGAGTANDDGTGGTTSTIVICFTGNVYIAGTSPRVAVVEF